MKRIDFVISNNRHHVATFEPVIERLREDGDIECRVLSLCEFRGQNSPDEVAGIRPRKLTPAGLRRRFYGGAPVIKAGPSRLAGGRESCAKRLAWSLLLGPQLRWLWSTREPSLVVVPNDYVYPYNHIMALLHRLGIRSLLVQEGIRFPLPNAEEDRWGTGGATAIAAWGESTAKLLAARGVDPKRIHLVGAPRFDSISTTDWKGEAAKLNLPKASKRLLLVTNPIDHQGFCSTKEKVELVRRFITGALPVLKSKDAVLLVMIHSGERLADYRDLTESVDDQGRVHLIQALPLYPVLSAVDAVVILASTVGLEALLFNLPLGVLEVPGVGFAHDYVARGVASPLPANAPIPQALAWLLDGDDSTIDTRSKYLKEHLASSQAALGLHGLTQVLSRQGHV